MKARKLLLLILAVTAPAALMPAPASAVTVGRACARPFQSGADYGCEFIATGTRIRILGVALDGPSADVFVWVTATPNPTAEALVSCRAPTLPSATACRGRTRNDTAGVKLYCWGTGRDRGAFACLS